LGQGQIAKGFQDSHTPSPDASSFCRGFVLGQTAAYIEQVITGAKLAAQLGCGKGHLDDVLLAVRDQGCESIIEERGDDRIAIWIFRLPFVRQLIEEISREATPPTAAGVWAMGKLFGYSDSEIGVFLQSSGLLRSASDLGASLRPCSGKGDLHTEQGCFPY